MRILFVDESGCLGALPQGYSKIQPALCIAGLIVEERRVEFLTREWIDLKKRFFPRLCNRRAKPWDWQRAEIKGSEVRADLRQATRRRKRQATGFVDKSIDLLESHDVRLVARCWIKNPGQRFDGNAVYTFSIQDLCKQFQSFLIGVDEKGLVVADSRMPGPNSRVSHSVFTQRYQLAGDMYPNLIEVPLFGHSDNHAVLQLADVVASTLLFPICLHFFIEGRIQNLHIKSGYERIAKRYCPALKRLEYRSGPNHKRSGGIVISDPVGKLGAGHLFSKYAKPNQS